MILKILFCILSACTLLTNVTTVEAAESKGESLSLKAADGVTLHSKYYKADRPKALILLFHQAGSNYAEYSNIVPRLALEGYSVLAIDQRSGGKMFGRDNETVRHFGKKADYLDALPDLEAALAWAKGQSMPIAVWGSSYSSSLVFLLANKHPAEIAAVLSFSPGEYFDKPDLAKNAAAKVNLPIYVSSAKDAEEIKEAQTIFKASPSKIKTQFLPKVDGIHGSSTLRSDDNPKGNAENWIAVLGFLKAVFK